MSDKTICTTCLRLKQGLCDGEKELTACPSYKRMTNADRIRAMTDEELAIILMRYTACHTCRLTKLCKPNPFKSCYEVNLDWLKQEVSDNG